MSTNFKQLFVVIERGGALDLIIVENDILQRYSTSLLNLSIKHAHILGTISYINDTIECIVWKTVLLEMDNKVTKYASSEPQGSISGEFLELLLFGSAWSPALEQFLLRDLTEKGSKKLGNSNFHSNSIRNPVLVYFSGANLVIVGESVFRLIGT